MIEYEMVRMDGWDGTMGCKIKQKAMTHLISLCIKFQGLSSSLSGYPS